MILKKNWSKVVFTKDNFEKFDQKSSFVKTTFDQIILKSDLKVFLQKTTFGQIWSKVVFTKDDFWLNNQ